MDLVIGTRNLELLPEVHKYVEKRMARLARHLRQIGSVKVELTQEETRSENHRVVAQVTLDCQGTLLRSQERALDVFKAIDAVSDSLDRQIERYKGKLYKSLGSRKSGRRETIRASSIESEEVKEGTQVSSEIVRIKRFPMKHMLADDAIHQMELLGHDFFLFYNSATKEFNLVYRRRNGGYSIIEPELL